MEPGAGPRYLAGTLSRVPPMPAMLRAPPAMIQPHLDLKHFLSFPMEAPAPAGVFPTFGTMDPVQKAVLSHTFGTPPLKAKRPVISCNVCQIRFNSESQAEAHYKGNRHARRVKGIEAAKTRQKEAGEKLAPVGSPSPGLAEPDVPDKTAELPNGPGAPAPAPPSPAKAPGPTEPPQGPRGGLARARVEPGPGPGAGVGGAGAGAEEEKAKKLLYCALCKVAVNSLSQLEAHNKGLGCWRGPRGGRALGWRGWAELTLDLAGALESQPPPLHPALLETEALSHGSKAC